MGLAWQQGPLGAGPVGHFLTAEPLPTAAAVRRAAAPADAGAAGRRVDRRQRGRAAAARAGPLPGRVLPLADVSPGVLVAENRTTQHRDLGDMRLVHRDRRGREVPAPPGSTPPCPRTRSVLDGPGRVRAGGRWTPSTRRTNASSDTPPTPTTASTSGDTSRHLVVRDGDRVIADTHRPAGPLRVGFRAALVCASRGHRPSAAGTR